MKASRLWILGGLLIAGTASAQFDQGQLVRPNDAADLNNNLARLASNPRDVTSLIGAGEAALALDDPRAATGFFARADAIESGNGRIKAGLARVMLQLQNPGEAIRLFDQASRLGYPDTTILSDRGLARDMTGDQAGAQRDYQAALKLKPDDAELERRYAASLGISGQVDAAERVLQPLLYKSDRAAWRYRAFIRAMNNQQPEAKKIVDQTMPAQLAGAIIPYLQKMPYLTAAQKAAAVHFGHFPTTVGTSIAAITPTAPAPVGAGGASAQRPQVATAAPEQTAKQAPADSKADRRASRLASRSRLKGTALARADDATVPMTANPPASSRVTPDAQGKARGRLAPAVPAAASGAVATTPAQSAPVQSAASQPTPPSSAAQPARQIAQAPVGAVVQGPPAPGFDSVETARAPTSTAPAPTTSQAAPASPLNAITLAQASTGQVGATPSAAPSPPPQTVTPQSAPENASPTTAEPEPAPAPPPPPDPNATRTLADIIRAIDVPEAERQSSVAVVDLTEIEAIQATRRAQRQAAANAAADKAKKAAVAKAKAEADAKAKKEAEEKKRLAANPSRNWLQVGVGQSKSALGFTMKGLRKKYSSLAPQDAWSAGWGRTNRLLVGPFSSFTRAKELEDKLKAAGADVFAWKSDAGEEVEKLGGE